MAKTLPHCKFVWSRKTLQLNFFDAAGGSIFCTRSNRSAAGGVSPAPVPWSGPLTAGLRILIFWTSWPKGKPQRNKLGQKQPLERYGLSHTGWCSCSISLHCSSPLLELWVLSFAVMNQMKELNLRRQFNLFLHEESNA